MVRLLIATGVFAAAGFAGMAAAPAASADPLCESASVDTIATNPVSVGPTCVPYSLATECDSNETAFTPWFSVDSDVCVPAL